MKFTPHPASTSNSEVGNLASRLPRAPEISSPPFVTCCTCWQVTPASQSVTTADGRTSCASCERQQQNDWIWFEDPHVHDDSCPQPPMFSWAPPPGPRRYPQRYVLADARRWLQDIQAARRFDSAAAYRNCSRRPAGGTVLDCLSADLSFAAFDPRDTIVAANELVDLAFDAGVLNGPGRFRLDSAWPPVVTGIATTVPVSLFTTDDSDIHVALCVLERPELSESPSAGPERFRDIQTSIVLRLLEVVTAQANLLLDQVAATGKLPAPGETSTLQQFLARLTRRTRTSPAWT